MQTFNTALVTGIHLEFDARGRQHYTLSLGIEHLGHAYQVTGFPVDSDLARSLEVGEQLRFGLERVAPLN